MEPLPISDFFIGCVISYGQLNVTIFLCKGTAKIIMPAVDSTCTAFTFNIMMSVSGFYDIVTEFALNSVFDDFSHMLHLFIWINKFNV